MRTPPGFLALSLVCVLMACTGRVASGAPAARPQLVFLYGDSTMQNMGEDWLRTLLPPGSQVSNRGQAGQCATEAVNAFVAEMPRLPEIQ